LGWSRTSNPWTSITSLDYSALSNHIYNLPHVSCTEIKMGDYN